MMPSYTHTLINPQNGELAFKVVGLDNYSFPDTLQRLSYYTVVLISEGQGKLQSGFSEHEFSDNTLLCFAPYQPFLLDTGSSKGYVINFHPDFFCIHKHHKEVACNGVLFNNIYQPPFHELGARTTQKLLKIIGNMQEELRQEGLAQHELMVSFLKIFLITASRSRAGMVDAATTEEELSRREGHGEPFVLQKLKDAIEEHYRQKHSAGEYAQMLNISPKALARMTKAHFSRTLTDMIAERIVIEAKRELYLTAKPVKAIAYELGFGDEYHFSRFFKNKAAVSPQVYRNKVGFARGEI
ncbi:MAG TPA: AraC family transcriptional regulator [Puia sp.]|nr:AraC family transcriptional regulator [Puia sp.]